MDDEKKLTVDTPDELKPKKGRGRPSKQVPKDLIAYSVADLLEKEPDLSPNQAVEKLGYRFPELSKGTKEEIRNGMLETIKKFHVGDPAALKAIAETIHMIVLQKAIEKNDPFLMLQVADRIAKRPDVGLDGSNKNPEMTITFEGLEKAIEKSKDLGQIIDITPKDEQQK